MNQQEFLASLAPASKRIDGWIIQDLDHISPPNLREVLRHALLNGGKRIRPLLTLLSSQLCGRNDEEGGRVSILFEYLHAASLLHDDIIDRSTTRRGHPTAHQVFGLSPVILAGDYLHSRATRLAGEACPDCLAIVCRATAAMIESEFLQMEAASRRDASEPTYFAVLEGKTAALIAAAAETGVVLGGGNADQRAAVRAFAGRLGIAFQIVDDLLDYQGDPTRTGKTVGNDFLEGKMTLPLLCGLNAGQSQTGERLRFLLNLPVAERQAAIPEAIQLIETAGGFATARARATALVSEAMAQLSLFPASPARAILDALARYVLEREK